MYLERHRHTRIKKNYMLIYINFFGYYISSLIIPFQDLFQVYFAPFQDFYMMFFTPFQDFLHFFKFFSKKVYILDTLMELVYIEG